MVQFYMLQLDCSWAVKIESGTYYYRVKQQITVELKLFLVILYEMQEFIIISKLQSMQLNWTARWILVHVCPKNVI